MTMHNVMVSKEKKELLRLLLEEKKAQVAGRQTIQPRKQAGDLPLSFAQQRLWFLDQLRPDNSFYNIPAGLHLQGPLKLEVLEASLNEIVRRHEALRTTFHVVAGQPVQVIAPTLHLPLPVVDLRTWPPAERMEEALRRANQDALTPFDLQTGPLLRASVLQMGGEEHVLLLTLHHIVADGWSLGIFNHELMQLYSAFARGQQSPLPALTLQYADFAVWQREWLQGSRFAGIRKYWKERLSDAPMLQLPTDHPRPAIQTFRGERHSFVYPQALVERLKEFNRREGVTMFMTLLTAFLILLRRYCRQEDLVVGTPIANRTRAELEPLIGVFINMLALRTQISGQASVREVVQQVREMALGAYARQDMPFEQLVEMVQPERALSQEPLFQVMFVLQNAPGSDAPRSMDELVVHPLRIQSQTAKFDLTLTFGEREQELDGFLEYNVDLFEAATIQRMARHLQIVLESIVATPELPVARLPLLTLAEQQQWIESNATTVAYSQPHLLHQLFEAQVVRSPQALALLSDGESLSYQQLNTRANQLAHHLLSLGVGPEIAVGVCLPAGAEAAVALLAILKAGGVYVPLDPSWPSSRHAQVLAQSHLRVLLTHQPLLELWEGLAAPQTHLLCLEHLQVVLADLPTSNPAVALSPDHLAYSLYTSGSTGQPKGVLVSHRAICNRVLWSQQHIPLTAADRLLQLASWSFDIALWELFGPWLVGALVIVPQPGTAADPRALLSLILQRQVTVVHLVPSLLLMLLEEREISACRNLRSLLCGGEALAAETLVRLQASLPIAVQHFYGPTEAAISSTCWSVEPGQHITLVCLGHPIANTQVYLLDQALEPVPIGAVGELYLGGICLARGYQGRADLTAERFVPHPWSQQLGERLYRTGDLARYLADGSLVFVGREDQQIKLRGHRIELGEIEAALVLHPAVREAVVVALPDTAGQPRLVGYVVAQQTPEPTSGELRHHLQAHLPDYMLPAVFVLLEHLPLSANGKLDRRALPAPDAVSFAREETQVSPRDALEWQLLQIFEEVLGIHPISVTDNFFTLGGHSLSAVQLMARVEKLLGQHLPLSTLFQGATVEYLASILRQQAITHQESPLVQIQPQGSKPPLFCVHPIGGEVFCYIDLARLLGTDQPCIGLQAVDLEDTQAASTGLEDIAASYVKALRAVQPRGPYLLSGWSFGGLVAFEMARQLWKQGDRVALLALLDPPMPGIANQAIEIDDVQAVNLFIRDLQGRFGGTIPTRNQDELQALNWDELLYYVLDIARSIKLVPSDAGLPQVRRLLHIFKRNTKAMLKYTPQAYTGNIQLFRTNEGGVYDRQDPAAGWRNLAEHIEIHLLPGNHYTFLKEPFVQSLTEQLKICLDEALADEA